MVIRAALLTELNAPLQLCELESEPLQYGQVLCKVIASGICGAQLQEISGTKLGGPLPHPLGHEACVEVVETGVAVTRMKVGDRCVAHWRKGDGVESDFPRYRMGDKTITGGKVTTFSNYSVISENRLTPVPNNTPVELCALLGCGLSTALGTIENEANLKMGETVLIIGCGGLGLNLILASKMRRSSHIYAVDSIAKKGESAFSTGANTFDDNFDIVCGYFKFDVVIDTTGSTDAIANGLQCLAPSGRFIMVGQPAPGVSIPIHNARHLFDGEGCSIKATQGGMFRPSVDISRYVKLHQDGLLNLDGIVTHRLPLTQINDGIELVRNGQAGRIMIAP